MQLIQSTTNWIDFPSRKKVRLAEILVMTWVRALETATRSAGSKEF